MSDRYILDGKIAKPEPDLLKWGEWFQSADRHVACDVIGEARISTVFLGLDHNHAGLFGPSPLLFETMVFDGPLDGEQDRYATWEEAERGHAAIMERVRQAFN